MSFVDFISCTIFVICVYSVYKKLWIDYSCLVRDKLKVEIIENTLYCVECFAGMVLGTVLVVKFGFDLEGSILVMVCMILGIKKCKEMIYYGQKTRIDRKTKTNRN